MVLFGCFWRFSSEGSLFSIIKQNFAEKLNTMSTIADIRKEYELQKLNEADVEKDAIKQFDKWWNDAINCVIDEVNAFTLATATPEGKPSARIVLLKGYDENGFIFFTNYESKKGKELEINPKACLVFFWKEIERQIRVEGVVEKTSDEESDAYFASRPEGSRLGAWSSPQSSVIENRDVIEMNVVRFSTEFENKPIVRPSHWGGYIVKPLRIEFWQGRSSRLHDRILYSFKNEKWIIERLAP